MFSGKQSQGTKVRSNYDLKISTGTADDRYGKRPVESAARYRTIRAATNGLEEKVYSFRTGTRYTPELIRTYNLLDCVCSRRYVIDPN